MPPLFIVLHLFISAAAVVVILRLPDRARVRNAVGAAILLLVVLGLLSERVPTLAWESMRIGLPSLVFLTNQTLAGAAVLITLMWRTAADNSARIRALVLAAPLLGAAGASYAWYFEAVPAGLAGKVGKNGLCLQTSDDSCSAAAAATLLARYGIDATEAEMARLCLTRPKAGTPPLGLYRGLAVKGAAKGLRPRLVRPGSVAHLGALKRPCILAVGLSPKAPPEIQLKMENYGWQPGQRHAVAVLGADPKGKWLDVADPTFGRERWPSGDIEYLWDGRVVVLMK